MIKIEGNYVSLEGEEDPVFLPDTAKLDFGQSWKGRIYLGDKIGILMTWNSSPPESLENPVFGSLVFKEERPPTWPK